MLGVPTGLVLAVLVVPSIAYALARSLETSEEAAHGQAPWVRAWRSGLVVMSLILWHPVDTSRALWFSRNLPRQRGFE